MSNLNSYYEILGLKPGASIEEIKQARKELALMLHPDKFSDNLALKSRANEQLKKINQAYEELIKSFSSKNYHTNTPKQENERQETDSKRSENHSNLSNADKNLARGITATLIILIFITVLYPIINSGGL